jgi:hypothetical protein
VPAAHDKNVRRSGRGHGANGVSAAARGLPGGGRGLPGGGRKRRYERTTPIGRAQKNLIKVSKALALVKSRLASWGASENIGDKGDSDKLGKAMTYVVGTSDMLSEAMSALSVLEKSGFVPAKRSSVLTFKADDEVQIIEKYREKYLEVYTPEIIGALVVAKMLPSGEIAVKHGKTALIVPKSHLGRRA